jgi:hypothetical protein
MGLLSDVSSCSKNVISIYERHSLDLTVLYQSVARAWPKIGIDYAISDQSIAPHVTAEFERYKRCGILEHGFVRLYCKDCQAERVIGFSCKDKRFCPTCGARRAVQKADQIQRDVWANAWAIQWVLTFPHQIRRRQLVSTKSGNFRVKEQVIWITL